MRGSARVTLVSPPYGIFCTGSSCVVVMVMVEDAMVMED